ncbi:T20D4.11-like domain-containing protein [Caenorhabditis elegans]|uniref:T20D4.11-like domain-containing protein n=1 Tax=Caenorhabditis elegans TaxID=6239 RepID=O16410_CAEEL|nr:DUF19 domain-containing protein [Caenorhabditis elegans]CCD66866.1 DUF19 domain-containing protein [Caenorhabditis elegans]|eukprot:NP_503873.1 Uncharacterized protein CELE_C36C5.15 [Caenorhabditis elegans]
MADLLKLVLIGTVLLGVAHGASLAAASATDSNCTTTNTYDVVRCGSIMKDFVKEIDELDMNDKDELKEFKKSCDTALSCLNGYACVANRKDAMNQYIENIKNYCEAVQYVHFEFSKCGDKLNAKKSQCYDDWDPIPNKTHLETDAAKIEKIKNDACKTYFGKDDCMKKEVTETCGKEEWDSLRKQFVLISRGLVSKCDFSRLD